MEYIRHRTWYVLLAPGWSAAQRPLPFSEDTIQYSSRTIYIPCFSQQLQIHTLGISSLLSFFDLLGDKFNTIHSFVGHRFIDGNLIYCRVKDSILLKNGHWRTEKKIKKTWKASFKIINHWLFYLTNTFVQLGKLLRRYCRRENLRNPAKFSVLGLRKQVLKSFWSSIIIQQEETWKKSFNPHWKWKLQEDCM